MKVIPSVCGHDCGGACPLNVHVKDGKIVKIEAHDVGLPAFRPCLRGLLYHYRVYSPDRVKYPMKRIGEKGEGKFTRISWDEALEEVAGKLTHFRDTYGASSILNLSHSGAEGRLHQPTAITRFLNMAGGQTKSWGGVSYPGGFFASIATYGRLDTGNDRSDLLNSKMIILWGTNPAESVFGTETRWYMTQAKEKGVKIVCIDPRFTKSAAAWASPWIPIRPGTDAAMIAAMAHVILEKGLQDQHFLDTHTVGFDKYRDYVTGAEDSTPKTPEWAEKITGVPAETIRTLAIEYATTKPAAIIVGFAAGRAARGEQYHRATATLSAMTGNVGIHGGATACLDLTMNPQPAKLDENKEFADGVSGMYSDIPVGKNPVAEGLPPHEYAVKGIRDHTIAQVHYSKVWDAIIRGKAGGYYSDIKMMYIMSGNGLNQFVDTNRGVEALKKLDFMVINEQFITPTAKFADIILPATTWCERNDIRFPWMFGHYALFANKVIEPMYECKDDITIFTELADRMGIVGYNDKTEDEWLRFIANLHGIKDYDTFKATGIYVHKSDEPHVAFDKQIKEPEKYKFPTPSGKIEIFCQRIADFNRPDELPAIAKYVESWEGVSDPKRETYPLQLIQPHPPNRIHSQYNNPWYRDLEPHAVWINPVDAKPRNIKNQDQVKIFNDRGAVCIPAKVTNRIVPGVVSIFQGAWYNPDKSGLDWGGCSNVLAPNEHSPGGAFSSNTGLVQVEKI